MSHIALTPQLPFGEDQYRRSRRYATALLVVMAAVFLTLSQVEDPGFWVRLAHAGSEAALVGGLADWFAVTAIFRHPLHVPIPHTAVVPQNKDRIGQGLGAFLEQHFFDPVLVTGHLRQLQLTRRAGLWLSRGRNASRAADQFAGAIPLVLSGLDDRQVQEFLHRALSDHIHNIDLAPSLGAVLHLLRESDRHQDLFDHVLSSAQDYLKQNESKIYEVVETRSNWWIPSRFDRKVARAIVLGTADLLEAISHRDHEVRRKYDAAVEGLINDLRESPELAARIQAVRDQVINRPEMQAYLGTFWGEFKRLVEQATADRSSDFRRGLADMLKSFGSALAHDREIQERVDQRIEDFTRSVLSPFRAEIGRFIADVVRGWEARTISERIEHAVGRDLQYIRINGTIVGAIVGCSLFFISDRLL